MACASYVVGGKNFTANFDGGCSPTAGTNTPQGGAAVSAAPTKLLLTPTECTEHTETSAERDSHGWHGWTQMLGCAGIEQRIKPIERVPAAWDFQQRIESIERIL